MKEVTILVVEDNRVVFELIKTALTTYPRHDGYHYRVVHAQDGVYGLEQAWLLHPDVILLDIQMPRLDGYEVLQSLRLGGNTTPVIMMTANTEEDERQRGFQAGCNAFITKPLKPSFLHHHIQGLLQNEAVRTTRGRR
jgi:CheY-like chemotaxis protein